MADAESSAFSASKSTMVIDSSTVDVTGGLSAAALTGNRTCTGLKCSLGAAPSSRSAPKVWLRVSLTRETSASFDNLLRMLAIVSSPSSKSRPSSKFSSSDSLVIGSAYDEVNLAALHSRSRVSIQTPPKTPWILHFQTASNSISTRQRRVLEGVPVQALRPVCSLTTDS